MRSTFLVLLCLLAAPPAFAAEKPQWAASKSKKPVKVFILAGQSNMEGRGFPEPLAWQVTQEKYRERWTHLIKDGDYDAFTKKVKETTDPNNRRQQPTYLWSTRHDVWISYRDKHGPLTNGYGAPRNGFGPELNFGHVLGDHYDEQVLLIKTSWGGRALARGFLPPSSMLSDAEYAKQAAELNATNKAWNEAEPKKIAEYNKKAEEYNKTAPKNKQRRLRQFKPRPMVSNEEYKSQYGKDYRNMVAEVHGCLRNLKERFPGYQGQGYEIVGFVWFQGWNDQYNDRWLSYEKNMANLIRDVRKEFKSPKMKFVIGQMGHDGMKEDKEGSPRDYIKKAQAKVPTYPEFKGNVVCVKTDKYWDLDAHAIYTGPGGWAKDINVWRRHGNDRGYHYYGSPWFFAQAGTGFGEAMVELLKQ